MTQGDPGVLVPLRLHRRLIAATVLGGALVLLAYATMTSTSPVETVATAVPPIVVLVVLGLLLSRGSGPPEPLPQAEDPPGGLVRAGRTGALAVGDGLVVLLLGGSAAAALLGLLEAVGIGEVSVARLSVFVAVIALSINGGARRLHRGERATGLIACLRPAERGRSTAVVGGLRDRLSWVGSPETERRAQLWVEPEAVDGDGGHPDAGRPGGGQPR